MGIIDSWRGFMATSPFNGNWNGIFQRTSSPTPFHHETSFFSTLSNPKTFKRLCRGRLCHFNNEERTFENAYRQYIAVSLGGTTSLAEFVALALPA